MSKILVFGNINIETRVAVSGFPLAYESVRYVQGGVESIAGGVGFNVAKVLVALGNEVRLLSMVGQDSAGILTQQLAHQAHITPDYILPLVAETPQSVVLHTPAGKRAIFTDLKNLEGQAYPPEPFAEAIAGCDLAVMTNINYTRAFLRVVKNAGIPIATDIHTISQIDDSYNSDYMAHADILFQSHEHLPCSPGAWAEQIFAHYDTKIVVVGMGAKGAWLAVRQDDFSQHFPVQPIIKHEINTIGAGDALFASFNHTFAQTNDPYLALKKALIFTRQKIMH